MYRKEGLVRLLLASIVHFGALEYMVFEGVCWVDWLLSLLLVLLVVLFEGPAVLAKRRFTLRLEGMTYFYVAANTLASCFSGSFVAAWLYAVASVLCGGGVKSAEMPLYPDSMQAKAPMIFLMLLRIRESWLPLPLLCSAS